MDIKDCRNKILHKNYKEGKDYKEVTLEECKNLMLKKKHGNE